MIAGIPEEELMRALEESVKLQSHYAELLNMHDGGKRLIFKNSFEWIVRLRQMEKNNENYQKISE